MGWCYHSEMYIGHYAAAGVILAVAPETPVLPIAIAVAYPDLLWPFLVFLGKEKVSINPKTPLQKSIRFISYPHSHSLMRSAFLTIIPSVVFGLVYQDVSIAFLFWIGALSHWLLDIVVHVKDLPVFGKNTADTYVGLGLWQRPKLAFVLEYLFFAMVILVTASSSAWPALLYGGLALHLLNANSFFGLTKSNPTKTPNQYASLALFGFSIAIVWFTMFWA